MIRPLLAAALVLCSMPAFAEETDDVRQPDLLYACGTGEDALQGMLKLVADYDEDDDSFTNLQFLESDQGSQAAPWPGDSEVLEPAFRFSNSDGPDGYFWDFASLHGADTWHLFYVSVAADEPDEVDSSVAGLAVVDPAGTVTVQILCGESPTAYFMDLKPLVGCDEANPLGVPACSFDHAPPREKSLLETYPWLDQVMPADWRFRK